MKNEFVTKEIDKIFEQNTSDQTKASALASAWIAANFKAFNIKIYDVKESSSLCDYNIIASASNPTQSKRMADALQFQLKKHGHKILSLEGLSDCEWVLLDAGDVIVHIFQEVSRDVFDLDSLWEGHTQVKIPNEYYHSHSEIESEVEENTKTEDYF